jgi:hypothetical protein
VVVRADFSLGPSGHFAGAAVFRQEVELTTRGGVFKVSHEEKSAPVIEVTKPSLWPKPYGMSREDSLQRPDVMSRVKSIVEGSEGLLFPYIRTSMWLEETPSLMRMRLDASALRADAEFGASRSPDRGLGLSGDGLALLVERLRPSGKKVSPVFVNALAGLRQVYPRIEDVTTIRFQPGRVALSFKERGIESALGQANVSDGVMHALALLLALELHHEQSQPIAIEEPENALHPWALRKIVERAQDLSSERAPILLTTHSPVVVDAVRDPASLFIVESSEKKGTVVTPALTKEKALRAILAKSGQKLGDIWLDGTLGGVPGAEP